MNKHEFALYFPHVTHLFKTIEVGATLSLEDLQLYHRITTVLRLKPQEQLILFDQHYNLQLQIKAIHKKNVECALVAKHENQILKPEITVLLPILKREAFEDAIYACVELGVSHIQLITTHKAQRVLAAKDLQRIQSIMIAAAEQSKQFVFPTIQEPIPLEQAVELLPASSIKLCGDLQGDSIFPVLVPLQQQRPDKLFVVIGPEGDFSEQEREAMQKNKVALCQLTPTVLRSQQALVVMLGMLRSIVR